MREAGSRTGARVTRDWWEWNKDYDWNLNLGGKVTGTGTLEWN